MVKGTTGEKSPVRIGLEMCIRDRKWYEKALEAFIVREESVKKKKKPYLQYRIGKMYASGLGAEQNYEKRCV